MKIKELTDFLERIAPLHLQEDYDNSGFLIGDDSLEVSGVLTCLDVTEDILDEATSMGCNLIIAHHPIIFKGLKSLTNSNYVERIVRKAIIKSINIYAIHTNLDNVLSFGVNEKIAQKIGLEKITLLAPSDEIGSIGSGCLGELDEPISEIEFLNRLKSEMGASVIRHSRLLGNPIKKIAICGGSGSFLLPKAIESNAQIFISSDFKYHEFFNADNQIIIADIGHWESEQYTSELLVEIIQKNFINFAAYSTKFVTNPVKYF